MGNHSDRIRPFPAAVGKLGGERQTESLNDRAYRALKNEIVRGLALLPHVSAIGSVRAVLLAGVACLHPARHRVADEEALDRAMTEVEPASGEQAAQLPDGGNGGLSRYTEDQGTMGFNASGAVVSARRSWTRIALDMCPPAPSADTRRTHAEDRTRSPFRHPLRVTRGPW